MSSGDAMKYVVAFGFLLILTRPLGGYVIGIIKTVLKMSITGLILMVIPLDFIDSWSKDTVGWAHISAVYVPILALLALIGLSVANVVMLSGSSAEQIAKIVIFVIGGIFTVGNSDWIGIDRSVAGVFYDVINIAVNFFQMLKHLGKS